MDWRNIPSLSALRAFEATARLGSFSAAARDLNVTHAAIAQHVRGLEAEFGQELAYRVAGGMELTEAGQTLAQALGEGFGSIMQGVDALRQAKEARPLRVTLTHAFAENWLMPRLGEFWLKHPDIPITLVPSKDAVDLKRQGFDLGLRYGSGAWPGLKSELLVPAHFMIVGRPELLKDVPSGDPKALFSLPWLVHEDWPEQDLWMKELGISNETAKVTGFATTPMTKAAVRAGLGVSVQMRPMIEEDLETGRLMALRELQQSDLGYHIITAPGTMSDGARLFIRWLKSTV